MEKKSNRRIEEIDALRGIASVMVLCLHYSKIYDARHEFVGFNFPLGYYGIYLFFVISGFVILLTLHRCKTALDFAVSRFSRIFPAYWTAAIITFTVVQMLGVPNELTFPQLALNFLMLERVFGYWHIDEVYWTLNVELCFYIWMGVFFKLSRLDKIQRVIPFVLLFQGLMALYVHATGHTFSQGLKVLLLLEYAHLFCAGMLFYEAWERGFTRKIAVLLLWCFLNHTLVPFRDFLWMPPEWWGDLAVLIVFVIMFFVVRGQLRWLVNPVLLFLGTVSYTLYLLHNEMGKSILAALAEHGVSRWPGTVIAIGTSFVLAILVTFVVEKPAMKWIRQFYRAHQKRGAAAGSQPPARQGEQVG